MAKELIVTVGVEAGIDVIKIVKGDGTCIETKVVDDCCEPVAAAPATQETAGTPPAEDTVVAADAASAETCGCEGEGTVEDDGAGGGGEPNDGEEGEKTSVECGEGPCTDEAEQVTGVVTAEQAEGEDDAAKKTECCGDKCEGEGTEAG